MGLAATEALAYATVVGGTALVVSPKPEPPPSGILAVYGNYANERGFWFNPAKFNVLVIADAPAKSEMHARALAEAACADKGKAMHEIEHDAMQERALFIPIKLERYWFDLHFRCVDAPASPASPAAAAS